LSAARAQAVVFDMDGTLIDSETSYRDAFIAAGSALGLQVSGAFHDRLVGLSSRDRLPLMLAEFGPAFPAAAFFADYKRRKALCLAEVKLRPGALDLVTALHRHGVACAVATSATRRTAEAVLEQSGLHFDTVVTRDDVEHGKPHPQTHLVAAHRLRHRPADCLALEDSGPGLVAAHAAGMITAAVGSTPPPPHAALLCRCIVSCLTDLHAHLPQWQLPAQ
jgi:HAD superfamily hydrolase (TIGR01509 family)